MTDTQTHVYRITVRSPGGRPEVHTVSATPERLREIVKQMQDSWYTEIKVEATK